ncbi:hypothetical protein GFH30_03610 [Acinetobacter wanghuae]|uniref:HNH endonuclease n=1 Tax=Acinetobacter wanghuae TaxID=2662362 RepID=A0A5Q0P0E2_9GAMM|nr:hypothetical protein [Acinetobacter wanghuae]MQW92301.1 hypothetical protein [Acinetobacter wanghuae]QGA10539.1 hypothetical protein GFH30_03610 [Acinetobacter wanghuae]
MFSVSRPNTVPQSLTGTNKDYRSEEVLLTLKKMFHGKCYLCERANISDIQVEHLDPHQGDLIKKFNWNNLFYSCSRCNSIKSHTHTNILDCSIANHDISHYLILECPLTNNRDIKVTVRENSPSTQQSVNLTLMLLDECYNNTSTGIRGISRSELIKDIQRYSFQLQKIKNELLFPTEPLAQSEIDLKIEKLKAMCSPQFAYSAFWKWAITLDEDLSELVGNVF